MTAHIRCAYADPPYLGCGKLYADKHPEALSWNDPETHRALIVRLCDEFPDGWCLSASTPSLRTILPMCPEGVRVGAWVKPFASFKPGVGVAYAWEPFIWRGGRKIGRDQDTVRDWCSANITLQRGLTGAKLRDFCRHIFAVLNLMPGDDLVDMFPGTNAVSIAWKDYCSERQEITIGLFATEG